MRNHRQAEHRQTDIQNTGRQTYRTQVDGKTAVAFAQTQSLTFPDHTAQPG